MRLAAPAAFVVVLAATGNAHADGAAAQLVEGCAGRLRIDLQMLWLAISDYTASSDSLESIDNILAELRESERTGAFTWRSRLGSIASFEADRRTALAKKEKRLREVNKQLAEIRARRARLERLLAALEKSPWAKRPPRDAEATQIRASALETLASIQPSLDRAAERIAERASKAAP